MSYVMKKIVNILILLATCNLAVVQSVCGEESIKIGTYPVPLMVESNTKGVFIELTQEICARSKIDCNIEVTPTLRTRRKFTDNDIIGFFPALDVIFSKEVAKSDEIYIKKDFIFTRKTDPRLTTMQELEGKIVGLTSGYPYIQALVTNKNIKFAYAQTDEQNMEKLALGRIDAFVVEEKSGLKAIDHIKLKTIAYDKTKIFSEQKVYYAFQFTDQGKELAKLFSETLRGMKSDGKFAEIMAKAVE